MSHGYPLATTHHVCHDMYTPVLTYEHVHVSLSFTHTQTPDLSQLLGVALHQGLDTIFLPIMPALDSPSSPSPHVEGSWCAEPIVKAALARMTLGLVTLGQCYALLAPWMVS